MIQRTSLLRLGRTTPDALFCTSPPFHQTPSSYLLLLLDQCTTLHQFKQIQASLTTSASLLTHPFLTTNLIVTLSTKLPHLPNSLSHALLLLSHSPHPNSFSCNTLLRALSLTPNPHHALHLFAQMLQPHFPKPNTFSFTFALKACARSHAHNPTKAIHCLAISTGHQSNTHIANTALHAYSSCGDLVSACKLFDTLPFRDAIRWNVMVLGYMQNGLASEALGLFHGMWSEGVVPSNVTVVTVLSACSRMKNLHLGCQIHGFVSKRVMQYEQEINVGTALLDMYAKCGCLAPAKLVFDAMKRKDTGVWNALIGGYVFNRQFSEALQSFQDLLLTGLAPDEPTLVSTLCACAHLGALDTGKRIHLYIEERYPLFDPTMGTALIEMYSKCGCIDRSQEVFFKMSRKDSVAWTSMIGGLAAHGHAKDALELFEMMKKCGMKPDGVTFVGVLSACSHAGLVEEGLGYFKSMTRDYGIVPRVEHFGCMIDLLSRAGRLGEALELISSMEVAANPIIWRSLLSACRINLDVELAKVAVENLRKLRSGHCGDYVLLSNIYALKGGWDDARRVRRWMKEEEIRKKPAFSMIELNDS